MSGMVGRVGWLLAFVVALVTAGQLLFGNHEALAKAEAVEDGSALPVEATLHARLDTNDRGGFNPARIRNAPDEWKAEFEARGSLVDLEVGRGFNVPGRGEVLHEWDGSDVTCLVWNDGTVIGVRLPDGTVLASDQVGWRGAITLWAAGVFALGAALLIGGTKLRFGVLVAFAGGVLVVAAALAAVHIQLLWLGLAVDGALVLGVVWLIGRRVLRPDEKVPASGRPSDAVPGDGADGA